nr:peroxisomal membrane protein 4 isoform X8 [Agelaius phoeniceus]
MAGGGDSLRALLRAANALLQQRRYHAALAVIKGFRNGAVYGAKIRAPHALVMTFLFKSGSFREKLKSIAQATYAHSRNLAYFVFTYKGLLAAQSRLQGKKIPFHSFLAACIGGWLVFGDNNPINSQLGVCGRAEMIPGCWKEPSVQSELCWSHQNPVQIPHQEELLGSSNSFSLHQHKGDLWLIPQAGCCSLFVGLCLSPWLMAA